MFVKAGGTMKTQISYKTYSGDSNLNLLVERGVFQPCANVHLGWIVIYIQNMKQVSRRRQESAAETKPLSVPKFFFFPWNVENFIFWHGCSCVHGDQYPVDVFFFFKKTNLSNISRNCWMTAENGLLRTNITKNTKGLQQKMFSCEKSEKNHL